MQAELGRQEKAKQAACTVVPVALEIKWVHVLYRRLPATYYTYGMHVGL